MSLPVSASLRSGQLLRRSVSPPAGPGASPPRLRRGAHPDAEPRSRDKDRGQQQQQQHRGPALSGGAPPGPARWRHRGQEEEQRSQLPTPDPALRSSAGGSSEQAAGALVLLLRSSSRGDTGCDREVEPGLSGSGADMALLCLGLCLSVRRTRRRSPSFLYTL